MADDFLGKKVFFLYPPGVIQDEMLDMLIMNGFESYVLKDHERALRIIQKFPSSILFVNIDMGLKEPEWERYIRAIQTDPRTSSTRIGIFSYNTVPELVQKYLIDVGIPCGFVHLKIGAKESTKIVMQALYVNEARGRRNSIRISCQEDNEATMNYKSHASQSMYYGKILDISSAGFAALIRDFPVFPANTMLKEVQLKLHGSLLMVDAILMGGRKDNRDVQIFIFDPKMTPYNKLTIHRYIKQSLQHYIDQLPL
jgi:hypothetical protein